MDAHLFDASDESEPGRLRPPFDARILKYSSTLIASLVLAGLLVAIAVGAEIGIAYEFGEIAKIFLAKLPTTSVTGRIVTIAIASGFLAMSMATSSLLARVEARKVKVNLRRSIVAKLADVAVQMPPKATDYEEIEQIQRSKLLALSTLGSDQVGLYVSDYLPSMIQAVVVPGLIFAYVALRDLTSFLIEISTFLAIPPLMIIFGRVAERRSQTKWRSMLRLSQQFGEFVGAMMTFKGLRAERRAEKLIDSASTALLRDTMSTLYLAFISGAVLEIISTVAIALVAVVMGVRLTHGSLDIAVSITVLILAPRPYMAIRGAAALFHTNVDAAVALDDAPMASTLMSSSAVAPWQGQSIEVEGVVTKYQRYEGSISFSLERGDLQFIVGKSGLGKTSLLRAFVGLERVESGRVLIDGRETGPLDSKNFAKIFSFLPQRAPRISGSVMDNIDMGEFGRQLAQDRFSNEKLKSVLYTASLVEDDGSEIFDLGAPMDDLGMAISAGQMRRVALARALLNGGPILVLDEPTANLDSDLAELVIDRLRLFAKDKILIIVTHDESLIREGDNVLRIGDKSPREKIFDEDGRKSDLGSPLTFNSDEGCVG
ncbi:MAG: ATP-binding cassette domain-containing protein [Actinomycetota bacterium]|nr:ATP-binding cassette domain-containing protein [Actinomycetota bacterium]